MEAFLCLRVKVFLVPHYCDFISYFYITFIFHAAVENGLNYFSGLNYYAFVYNIK